MDLAGAAFTRNGLASDLAVRGAPGGPDTDGVVLPCEARGVRWATTFVTEAAFTARLQLDWNPGPDGLLFEVVLDGQRLPPPRDGWRPSPRALSSDLGPAWLGRGSHLLEFVAREESPSSALHVRALVLERL
ncbi:MAG TPA: hypothetical protein VK824_00625 [Planctomycetota bacterium]|nr:hypothetical protein [Planctomycetota bacterium]